MAILGRSQPLPAIISRSDPRDFATTLNPVTTVVVAAPYARIWFKGPQATIIVDNPATFASTKNPNALVYTPLSKPQLVTPAIIVENPQPQAAPVFTATPPPLVYVPANPQPKFTLPLVERSSLADAVVAATATPQPLVITPPQRRGLTPASILLSRANPANLIITPVPPPVVYAPIVPRVWRGGRAIVWFPRGAFEPPPPPGDIDVCVFEPIVTWYVSPPFIDWVIGDPITGWIAIEPEEDC